MRKPNLKCFPVRLGVPLLVALLIAALSVGLAVAQGPAGGTWVSSFQVVNLDTGGAANVSATFYKEDGKSITSTSNSSVQPGSSWNVYVPSVSGVPGSYKGAVVISSNRSVAAIGSLQATWPDGSIGNSQYSGLGASEVGQTFYLPNLNKNYGGSQWSSRITVQNTAGSRTQVTVTYYNADGSTRATENRTLAANGSVTISQQDNASIPNGWLGSARVTSNSTNIAVIADVISADGRVESYNGIRQGATTIYLPTLLLNFGGNRWNSSFQVMNVSGSNANVTIRYYKSGSSTAQKTVTVNNLGSLRSINRYLPSSDPDLGSSWIGSVVIESTQPVVAVATQSSGAPGTRLASIYNGITQGATEVWLPTILRNFGGSNFVTSFQVMNVGGSTANVQISYYKAGSSTATKTVNVSIPSRTVINRYQPTDDPELGTGWQGSVRVTSNQPVVAIGSQNALNRGGDAVGQYNGVPK